MARTKSTSIPAANSSGVMSYERKSFDAQDVPIVNGEAKLDVQAALNGLDPLAGMEVEHVRMPTPAELSFEQFMAQDIELQFLEGSSQEESQFVEVTVNGDYRCFRRGDVGTVKRYHLEVLAAAKELVLKQTKTTNADGSMGYTEKMVSRMVYPFTVIHDPAGRRGADWLKQKLQQAR